jgi:hypothetical protein
MLHDELLDQAVALAYGNPSPSQADLRRAVSSAYYALFHLLIFEACANWNRDSSRGLLARMFDHGLMRRVSRNTADHTRNPFPNEDPVIVYKLRTVAQIFYELQDKRHSADYDVTDPWSLKQSEREIQKTQHAFATWHQIRNEKIALDYLVSLLIRTRD